MENLYFLAVATLEINIAAALDIHSRDIARAFRRADGRFAKSGEVGALLEFCEKYKAQILNARILDDLARLENLLRARV